MPTPSHEFFALQQVVAGRYSLDRELGRGGMGVVFLARDVALDRPVAIKLLPPTLAGLSESRERFLREARTAARLSHPHIVPIHVVEEHGDVVFYVMAFVDGETLGERVRRGGPLSAAEAMRVTQEVAWALGHAHAHGVVHRDVKPDNVLLERETGRALVADFGIARAAEGGTPAEGTPVGTPGYMSPEQGAGEPADARSDLYSLGATAYFAASGQRPFAAPSALAMLARQAGEPAPSLIAVRPSLPPAFARLVDRCLAKAPVARWQSADALAAAIGEARGAIPTVPAPVRAFLADADGAGIQLGTALCAAVVALVWMVAWRDLFGIMAAAMLLSAALTLGLAKLRFGQLVQRARSLLRAGYGHQALRTALALETRARSDGGSADAARNASLHTAALVAGGAAVTALSYWLANESTSAFFSALFVVGTIIVPAAVMQRVWSMARAGRDGLWHRMLDGAVGRALFRMAGVGLGDAARAVPTAGEPTVLALGRAAEELFSALSAADRQRLGDVPALLSGLQADALALRARSDDPAAAERHATAVAAMEAVRLDLLRLRASGGPLDELTRDVAAARALGRRIDLELAARAEVERLVARSDATPHTA